MGTPRKIQNNVLAYNNQNKRTGIRKTHTQIQASEWIQGHVNKRMYRDRGRAEKEFPGARKQKEPGILSPVNMTLIFSDQLKLREICIRILLPGAHQTLSPCQLTKDSWGPQPSRL